MNTVFPSDSSEVAEYLKTGKASFLVGSRTSTVIPYEKIEERFPNFQIIDLSKMKVSISLSEDGDLTVEGAVSWQEAMIYAESHRRKVLTSPTEELALCLSGVATSATGERCFGFGTLRDQIVDLDFLDIHGNLHRLNAVDPISTLEVFRSAESKEILKKYSAAYEAFRGFKNAPFPRFEKATDLMVGTEGQLGVVTRATFRTVALEDSTFLFFKLPKWELDDRAHLEIFDKVDAYRNVIQACEFVDENSSAYLPEDKQIAPGFDLIFIELPQSKLDYIYENFICSLNLIKEDDVFELSPQKCREYRMNIPRYVFEANQRMKVTKIGTDVQVKREDFQKLLEVYRSWQKYGIKYNVFGHFGDAHLHYNFMPSMSQYADANQVLAKFYSDLKGWGASPFAEHGIGLIKQAFIQEYYSDVHKSMFQHLKSHFDPQNVLFPNGFMSI